MTRDQKLEQLQIMFKFLNTKEATKGETASLKHASHEETCQGIQYWIDQIKLLFGDVVWTQATQSLRDDGVDVLADFINSKLRIGFQVKSYNDINAKDFTSKVKSQITDSRKHNLDKLILVLAGDSTDKSQNEKMRGLTSELHEMDDYVAILQAEKVTIIIQAYRNKQHPLKLIQNLSSIDITEMLSQILSDENYAATITIKYDLQKKVDTEQYPFGITMNLKATDSKQIPSPEEIFKSINAGQEVKIEKENIECIKMYEKGNLVRTVQPDYIVLRPEYPTFPVQLESVSDSGTVINSINLVLIRDKIEGKIVHLISEDINYPMVIELYINFDTNKITINYKIDLSKGDAIAKYNVVRFIASTRDATKVRLMGEQNKTLLDFDPVNLKLDPKSIDNETLEIYRTLALVQEKTGENVNLPEQIMYKDFQNLLHIAEVMRTGRLEVKDFKVTISLPKSEAPKLLEEYLTKSKIVFPRLSLVHNVNIFGREIPLGELYIDKAEMKPQISIEEFKKRIEEVQESGRVNIPLVSVPESKPVLNYPKFQQVPHA